MQVEPSVIKKELLDLKKTAENAKDIKTVAIKLNDIGFDHIPTTQYRSGTQIKTELLTHVSSLVATAKQGEHADDYIREAQEVLKIALHINFNHVYSTRLAHGDYHLPSYTLKTLIQSINQDLHELN